MAMKFGVEKKGQNFLVVNQTMGDVRGRFKEESDAKEYAARLQQDHLEGIKHASGKVSPGRADTLLEN